MYHEPAYTLRVIWACMKKDIKSALTERVFTIIGIFVPVNVLILMSLFVLSGGQAPTAVVMHDTGPYAQQFYDAMSHAHSFRLQIASASDAQNLISTGKIVAVVTIPADFDARIRQNQPLRVGVQINNLNTSPATGYRLYPLPDRFNPRHRAGVGRYVAIRNSRSARV